MLRVRVCFDPEILSQFSNQVPDVGLPGIFVPIDLLRQSNGINQAMQQYSYSSAPADQLPCSPTSAARDCITSTAEPSSS